MERKLLLIGLSAITMLSACKDEYTICSLSTRVNFIGGLYASGSVPRTAPNFTLQALNAPSPIYSNQSLQTFSLPLNPTLDSAKFVLSMVAGSPADTITIVYSSTSAFLSTECGSVIYNNITAVRTTLNTIDSIRITNPQTTTSPLETARIFF